MNSVELDTKIGKFNFIINHDKHDMKRWLDYLLKNKGPMGFSIRGIINEKISKYITISYRDNVKHNAIFKIGKKYTYIMENVCFNGDSEQLQMSMFKKWCCDNIEHLRFKPIQKGDLFLRSKISCNGPGRRIGLL